MWDMDSNVLKTIVAAVTMLFVSVGCTSQPVAETPIDMKLYQTWELQPGERISGYPVTGGLGDISIAIHGDTVYAPYDGRVQPHSSGCVFFSSTDVPNYLLRLCGVKNPQLGPRLAGEAIGKADNLQFAVLNKRPDGLWALVEPSKQILQQMLQRR